MNRYLVSKGWEGFCDRLQCLSHCVTWALRYNRILYVDWEDRIWSHGEGGFYRYFDLVDLPHVTSADQIPSDLEVFPPFWTRGLGLPAGEWVHKLKDELVFDPQEGRHYEPVWVHPGVGFRAFDFEQLPKHLRLKPDVADELKALLANVPTAMPVVHLRGTDRAVSEDRWQAVRAAAPVACIISDDAALVDRWLQESPGSMALSDTLVTGSAAGHKLDPQTLRTLGLDKHRMNIRLLADFIVLASAKEAHGLNEDSVFFKMARFFGACNGVSALFSPGLSPLPLCTPGVGGTGSLGGPSFQTNSHFVEPPPGSPRKLHIGGKVRMADWELLNVVAGNSVDHVGNAKDLTRFAENTFLEIYASHVLEHFDYAGELLAALKEWRRVLVPGGRLLVSVPDLDVLAALILDKKNLSVADRRYVMQMIFGGHLDRYDHHQAGINLEFLSAWLTDAGFVNSRQVDSFGLVSDTSSYEYKGHAISLNVIAEKG